MMKLLALTTATAVTFLTGSSFAADAVYGEVPAAPVAEVAPAAFSWTGPYIGVFGGAATGDFEYEAGPTGGDPVLGLDVSGSGFVGGAQVGYDWQSGNWVFGAVADIAFSTHSADISADIAGLGSAEAESELNYLGTVRARAGYAFDRALVYAHGGFAYGETEQTITAGGTELFNESQTRTGWTVGAGVEFAVTNRVSIGTEYSYVDLGDERVFDDAGVFVDEDVAFHTVKALINVRF